MLRTCTIAVASLALAAGVTLPALAGPHPAGAGKPDAKKPDFPPFDKVVDGLEHVNSAMDGAKPYFDVYRDKKTGKLLALLPSDYDKLFMIACTVSGGDPEAGVMGPTHYVKWRKINKQLALIAPNLLVRTDGDKQAKASTEHLFTGRVVVSTPILAMKGKRPVIDLGTLATAHSSKFFGASVWGAYGPSLGGLNPSLTTLTKTKAFPENVIFEYEAPRRDGQLIRLTYSIGKLAGTPGYKPRKADSRVGYFYNWHQDYARGAFDDITDRYIIRWNLEKADPKLRMSPPKEPIVWYIEHTTPIKYRRYVREGILLWNEAFAEIGFVGAVEVYQQDALTGAHMDKDPEDARYNFFRWNASDQGYAIGPSRSNPLTGEILDADVVWHQGLTRALRGMLENLSEDLVAQTFTAEDLAFLDDHPNWDPRVRIASPARRAQLTKQRELAAAKAATEDLHSHDHPWTQGINDPTNAACRMGNMLALDVSLVDAALLGGLMTTATDGDLLDGLPEEYIGPMIRYISAHEVGHCLGLQHNMAASTIHTLADINSKDQQGATISSVMDYCAANINHELGEVQGPYATPTVGPYDHWAIAYGYGPEDEVDEVLSKVSEPDHIYVSQLAMSVGSDPRNMTWDLGANNLNFAESRLKLAAELRGKLIDSVVKDGQSWRHARQRLGALMGTHMQAIFIAAPWVGGSYINNDHKGDPGNRAPIGDVAAEDQRRALTFIVDNTFHDEAFGITPELIRHLGREYWWDPAAMNTIMDDPSFNVHDAIGGIQATALTLVMSPSRLRRVYDNEFRSTGDVLTVAEIVSTVTDAAWGECVETSSRGNYSAQKPMISSFRRNLQREHLQRLVDLALLPDVPSPALRTISTLARQELRRVDDMARQAAKSGPDPYTSAHLADVRTRIAKALDAAYMISP
ncbi:MAG: zinc-dependent metalloprotease [Planctomycetota bacterium]|jgi:hypothetical protein